jgi:uncharacterized membrane protein YqgA involved in biofilm formation
MFPGFGTVVNVAAVLVGSGLGLLLGHRLPRRTRDTVTDALGLVTLLIGGLSALEVTSTALTSAVGPSAPVLIVLGSLLIGGIIGSLLDIEARLEGFGGWLRQLLSRRSGGGALEGLGGGGAPEGLGGGGAPEGLGGAELGSAAGSDARSRFIEGFVSASLVFCVGPLTILGSLSDGLGLGAQQLILKATLDGFASIAFAASLGIGVMASAVAVAAVQGSLTLLGLLIGSSMPAAHLAALTATGGLMLLGVGLRLLHIKMVPVGNLLPALVVAPALVQLVTVLR